MVSNLTEYYKEKYRDVLLYTMEVNHNGYLPVFIRKATSQREQKPLHRHEMFQINYVTGGRVCHEINQSRYELSKGHIFVIPPYVPHTLNPLDEEGYDLIELEFVPQFIFDNGSFAAGENTAVFDFAFVEPFLVAEQEVKPRLLLTGRKQQTVEEILESIWEEYNQRSDSFLLSIKADLLKLLVTLGRYFKEEMGQSAGGKDQRFEILRVLRYIDEHYNEKLTVEAMAKIANLSRSHFSSLFKGMTGKTLVEYITALRLKTAAELLRTTQLSVVEICFAVGFDCVNHFNRVFKKEFDGSPLQYRKGIED